MYRTHVSRMALALVAGSALAGGGALYAQNMPTTIARVALQPLNGSTASGEATLRLSGDKKTLTVMIKARGLEAGGAHVGHIHGLSANGQAIDSTCPTIAQDSDGDGFVELVEGQVKYGPILVDFMNTDPDMDGTVNFTKTVTLSGSEMALPLQLRHIVLHGRTVGAVGAGTPGEVDGTAGYKDVLPVLCGEINVAGNSSATQNRSRRRR